MSSADAEELDENAELIEGILNEEIPLDILRFERDVPEVDEIQEFFKFYSKHADKPSKKHDDIVKTLDYQIFEVICVCAWESVSTSGITYKNASKWSALSHHFDNILTNYPSKHWWLESLIKFLPACTVPKGVVELANKFRQTSSITKTWRERNDKLISGNTDAEVLNIYFGYKIEDCAKKAVHQVGMFYNKLYRTPQELPSGTNNMSHLYLAIKNCLFVREKKAQHCAKRQRQWYRDRPNKHARMSKTYAMEGFEQSLEDEQADLVLQDYFPKHWLTFHMCSHPITDRFPDKAYVS
jgi:hypothetical protein